MKYIICELRIWNQMKNDPRSCDRNFYNCVKKPEKNSGLQRGLNPWPREYRCDALPTELWSHWRWEQVNCGFICSRERYVNEWCSSVSLNFLLCQGKYLIHLFMLCVIINLTYQTWFFFCPNRLASCQAKIWPSPGKLRPQREKYLHACVFAKCWICFQKLVLYWSFKPKDLDFLKKIGVLLWKAMYFHLVQNPTEESSKTFHYAPVIWNPRTPQLGDSRVIHFFCQWNAVKAPPSGEKSQSELPRPLNIKHNSLYTF